MNMSPETEDFKSSVLTRYTTGVVISLAMCEFIAILGLLLFLMNKNRMDLFGLAATAAIGMLYYRPEPKQLVSLAKKLRNEKL